MFFQKSKKFEETLEPDPQNKTEDLSQRTETGGLSHDFILEPDFVRSREQKGMITVKVSVSGKEFTRFTILPDILTDAAGIVRGLIHSIEKPQVEITSNCECAWCNQKIHELKEFLEK